MLQKYSQQKLEQRITKVGYHVRKHELARYQREATLPHPDNVLDEVVNLANYRYSRGSIFMSTTEILEDLQQHGVHMDARQLQERLEGFDIKRDRTRIEGRLQRGYKVSSILRANRARNL